MEGNLGARTDVTDSARPTPRQLFWAASLVLATLLAGIGAIALTDATEKTAIWWPAGGLAIIAVMVSPRRWWPRLYVALTVAYFLANFLMGRTAGTAAALAVADVAETILVSQLLIRWVGRRLDHVQSILGLVLASGAGAVVAGLGVALTSATMLGGDFGRTLTTTTTAHTASLFVLLPVVMAPHDRGRIRRLELAAQATLLAVLTVVVFGPTDPDLISLTFAPLPVIVWAAVSFGPRIVAVQQLLVALVATAMTLVDWGPLARVDGFLSSQIVQLYVISLLATGLPLALAMRQHTDSLVRLQEERDYIAAIMNATPSFITVIAEDGTLLLVNPALEEASGYDEETLVGSPYWAHLVPADEREAVRADFLEHGLRPTGEQVVETADGRHLQVTFTAQVLEAGTVGTARYLVTGNDVTATRHSQEVLVEALEREREAVVRLRALDAARDDLISTVSHELRTPMTSILGSAELLADGSMGPLADDQLELIGVISRNGDRLLALANDLLALAGHESQQAEGGPRPVPLDLRDVIEESRGSVEAQLRGRALALAADLPESPVLVRGDLQQLERAVTNLLSNAIKFTPDGGRVSVGVARHPESGHAILTVSDTGLGIPEEEIEHVFDRFFRSSRVQRLAIQGTGLGLAIVKQVVEAHLGWIDLTSEEGAGTTFRITLPLVRGS